MFLTKLALRNLARHKKRTIITALVISFGIFIFLLSDSLMIGLKNISVDNNINLQTAHLQIMHENYWKKKDEYLLENLLDEDSQVFKEITEDHPSIKQKTARLFCIRNRPDIIWSCSTYNR